MKTAMHSIYISSLLALYAPLVLGTPIPDSSKLPKGTLLVPLTRIRNYSAYGVELAVGTPPQHVTLLADTGSPTIGLLAPTTDICEKPGAICAAYGTYNNLTSKTTKYLNNEYFDELSDFGYGDTESDIVRLGGAAVKNIDFGVFRGYGDENYPFANPFSGILGLCATCPNTSCTGYPTLQDQLHAAKTISSRVLSVYLGPDTYTNTTAVGHLLFSGIDRAKRAAPVVTLPMALPTSALTSFSTNNINVSSFTFVAPTSNPHAPSTNTTLRLGPGSIALLDTGNPYWGLPSPVFRPIKKYLKLNDSINQPPFAVSCDYLPGGKLDNPKYQLLVGVGANDELMVKVPMSRFVTKFAEGVCGTFAYDQGPTPAKQMSQFAYGDIFLRSVYFTADVDRRTMTVANVVYTNETDVVAA